MPQPSVFKLFKEQLNPPPLIRADLTGKTIIVIGANIGIGFEASKHLACMNPGRLILACRNKEKGESALAEIKKETNCETLELWLIDLSSFASVISFADKFEQDGGRLDAVLFNAAILETYLDYTADGWNSSYQINYMSSSLLGLLLLPRLLETAERYNTTPRMAYVSSGLHYFVKFDSKTVDASNALRLFGHKDYIAARGLNTRYWNARLTSSYLSRLSKKTYPGRDAYNETKLMSVFFTRALNSMLHKKPIIVMQVDPGNSKSAIGRNESAWLLRIIFALLYNTIARTAEEGSRSLVWAIVGGEEKRDELRGAFISTVAKVDETSDYAVSKEGSVAQDKLWNSLIEELTNIEPRVQRIVQEYLTPHSRDARFEETVR